MLFNGTISLRFPSVSYRFISLFHYWNALEERLYRKDFEKGQNCSAWVLCLINHTGDIKITLPSFTNVNPQTGVSLGIFVRCRGALCLWNSRCPSKKIEYHSLQAPQTKSSQMLIESYYKPILGLRKKHDVDDAKSSGTLIIKSKSPIKAQY